MSKSKKTTLLSLIIVLAAVSVITLIISKVEDRKEKIKNTDEVLLALDPDSVSSLSFSYGDYGLSFTKTDSVWQWDDDAAFPVDADKITELLGPFEELTAAFVIEEPDELSQYGLSDPSAVIDLTADGTEYELSFGAFSTLDQERYCSIGDGNVYLLTADPLDSYEVEISSMIENDEIPAELADATSITFEGASELVIEYEEDSPLTYSEDDVYFADGQPLDSDLVDSYLSTLTGFSLSSYVAYNATEEELTLYGLDEPELSITVSYPVTTGKGDDAVTETRSLVLHLGRNQDELKEAEENEDEDISVTPYIRVGESRIVYPITESAYNTLIEASFDDFRHKELFTGEFGDITSVDVTLEGESYTFYTTEETEDEETTLVWHYSDEEDDLYMTVFEAALYGLSAYSFTEEAAEGKEEIRLVLHLNDENFESVELAFYRYDGYSCLAEVNGSVTSLISRSYVVDMIEAVNEIVLN